MIESGSSVPGADPARWDLPAGTALRIDLPDADLLPFLTDYRVLDSEQSIHDGVVNSLLPSWPTIRFVLQKDTISLRLGPWRYDPLPPASLWGTTTRAMQMTSHGGISIGVGITPLGWSRLVPIAADKVRDRVIPLSQVLPAAAIDALMARLYDADIVADLRGILDTFFRAHLSPPSERDQAIIALSAMIADEEIEDISTISDRLELTPAALRRLSSRYFGYPPKLLLVRARFMRSFLRMMLVDGEADYSRIAPTYFDKSHFLRDARRFLDTTPRRFLQRDNRYVTAVMRARLDVLHHAQAAASPR